MAPRLASRTHFPCLGHTLSLRVSYPTLWQRAGAVKYMSGFLLGVAAACSISAPQSTGHGRGGALKGGRQGSISPSWQRTHLCVVQLPLEVFFRACGWCSVSSLVVGQNILGSAWVRVRTWRSMASMGLVNYELPRLCWQAVSPIRLASMVEALGSCWRWLWQVLARGWYPGVSVGGLVAGLWAIQGFGVVFVGELYVSFIFWQYVYLQVLIFSLLQQLSSVQRSRFRCGVLAGALGESVPSFGLSLSLSHFYVVYIYVVLAICVRSWRCQYCLAGLATQSPVPS